MLLRENQDQLTPSERKVARILLSDYPLSGLDPIAVLAARASVSGPTVVRLVAKLGFDGYPEFQRVLKEELGAQLSSPLQMYHQHDTWETGALERADKVFRHGIQSSFLALPPADFEAAARLLTDVKRPVMTVGGRFSSMLARYLATHLQLLRPGVYHVGESPSDRVTALLDVGRRHVVVAFDYRRYQKDTVRFGLAAKKQGARLILFTDPYLSPLAAHADAVLPTSVAAPSPFDALTPSMALVEGLIAAFVDRLGDTPVERISRYDALDEDVTWMTGDHNADT
jgi:DNA-binding MurR/RpiR family transcriptional regulator